MKIKLSELKKLIREELKVLREVEVVNRDTGETLTMPWEFEEEYDDGEELPDSAFKALRRDIDKLSSKSQKNDLDDWGDDDLDAPMSDLERKVSRQVRDELAADKAGEAVTDLTDLADELVQDWIEDNPGADIADVAHDLASGMKKTTDSAQWKLAVKYFDGKEPDLVSYLASMMAL